MKHHSIVPQPRDFALLKELAESRAVTKRHLAGLYFNGSDGAAHKRLSDLRKAGLIGIAHHQPIRMSIVQLRKPGYDLLCTQEAPFHTWPRIRRRHNVSPAVLKHELSIMDTKLALHSGRGISKLCRFVTTRPERFLAGSHKTRRNNTEPIVPDAYIEMHADGRANHFFLELDTGSQSHTVIQKKVVGYRSAKIVLDKNNHDIHKQSSPGLPFRILFVCLTAARRDQLIDCLQTMQPPVRSFALVTVLSELDSGGFDSAVRQPGLAVTKDQPKRKGGSKAA